MLLGWSFVHGVGHFIGHLTGRLLKFLNALSQTFGQLRQLLCTKQHQDDGQYHDHLPATNHSSEHYIHKIQQISYDERYARPE